VDPVSGRTYFYDTVTRNTQWKKVRCGCLDYHRELVGICWTTFKGWGLKKLPGSHYVPSSREVSRNFFLTHSLFFVTAFPCYNHSYYSLTVRLGKVLEEGTAPEGSSIFQVHSYTLATVAPTTHSRRPIFTTNRPPQEPLVTPPSQIRNEQFPP
jgi:hypothetical protein